MVPTELQLIGISDVERLIGRERSTIWRWCRAGTFPMPRYIGNRRTWKYDEVKNWMTLEQAKPTEARAGASNLKGTSVHTEQPAKPVPAKGPVTTRKHGGDGKFVTKGIRQPQGSFPPNVNPEDGIARLEALASGLEKFTEATWALIACLKNDSSVG
jgi:predicted DNA-binding transcriptional regulator AlpA